MPAPTSNLSTAEPIVEHSAGVTFKRAWNEWLATCSCGWVGDYLSSRSQSEGDRDQHLADTANQTIEGESAEDEGLDDCDACDAPLSTCSRDAACCDDCTHGANFPSLNHAIGVA